jgi:hypothetical protein
MMALRDYVDEGPVGKRRLPRLTGADLGASAVDDDEDDIEAEAETKAEPASDEDGDIQLYDA